MMAPVPATSPREFGAALRAARERSGVTIEVIADRTKIARRVLELLEAGDFAKLPNRVFVKLFLQQYLTIVGEPQESWIEAFETTWQRYEDASQPWEVAPPSPSRGTRWVPWIVGAVVVVGGLAAVVLVERQHSGETSVAAIPTPEIVLAAPTPTPAPEPTPIPEPTQAPADPRELILRAGDRPCWVEVHVQGERGESRLLAAGAEWRVAAAGRAVSLTVGDGGALGIEYLGERRATVGVDGEVVHLKLGPAPESPGPTL
jgi:cytoskeleton protein RodZ